MILLKHHPQFINNNAFYSQMMKRLQEMITPMMRTMLLRMMKYISSPIESSLDIRQLLTLVEGGLSSPILKNEAKAVSAGTSLALQHSQYTSNQMRTTPAPSLML
jgi:hypothetical protein